MVVVLLIISVVILIATSAFYIINKQLVNYQKQSDFISSMYLFINTIENDMESSVYLEVEETGIIFTKSNGKVEYRFDKHIILRCIQDACDTLIKSIPEIYCTPVNQIKMNNLYKIQFHLLNDTLTYIVNKKQKSENRNK